MHQSRKEEHTFINGLHSESWSSGNIPRCGGFILCFAPLKFMLDIATVQRWSVSDEGLHVVPEDSTRWVHWIISLLAGVAECWVLGVGCAVGGLLCVLLTG